MQIIENIIRKILILLGIIKEEEEILKEKTIYKKKNIMTDYEYKFYLILKELEKYNYKVIPQVNLATIIEKVNNKNHYTELFRNIDFVIFNEDLTEDLTDVLLLIEVNDVTHNTKKRKSRDIKVKSICNNAGLNLITFYTKYANEKSYVLNRVLTSITSNNNNNIEPTNSKIETP